MSDLKTYISKRGVQNQAFDKGFDAGYKAFKIGVILRQAREKSGLTQAGMANRLHTHKSAISHIENHAENVRLSTLELIALAPG